MKHYLKPFFITIILLVSGVVFSQTKPAKLILLDNSEFEGYGEIKINILTKSEKIVFRMDLEDKPDIWKSDQVKRIEFDNGIQIVAYEYVKVNKNISKLYRVIESGFMTLYAYDDIEWTNNGNTGNELNQRSQAFATKKTSYYIKRKDRDYLYHVTRNKNAWKRQLAECFNDCENVIDIVSNKNIKDYEIDDLVWEFNEYCGKTN
ncbi:hypothetical protein [uncultured Maribacter sp.]|uniref:hypothetical protein n=1 Tax=uncultured Maribacter sp. TaxID=431308 RepID=UPI0026048DA2|nr:hypothetical protein [uncultured Maribacter sp.]